MDRLKVASLFGISGIIAAWVTIIIAWHLNPWFSIQGNALSDLGGGNFTANGHPAPTLPVAYNGGMIFTSVLLAIYAIVMISISRNKIEETGNSFFIVAGIFLALIGIYHEGTYPHDFVSIWFFILASLAYGTISLGLITGGRLKIGSAMFAFLVASWLIYAMVPWGSVAEDEVFGILVVDIVVLIHIFSYSHSGRLARDAQ
ncbi:MAG: DUF998 domain-containing protein [Thermoplasmata archaeon]